MEEGNIKKQDKIEKNNKFKTYSLKDNSQIHHKTSQEKNFKWDITTGTVETFSILYRMVEIVLCQ